MQKWQVDGTWTEIAANGETHRTKPGEDFMFGGLEIRYVGVSSCYPLIPGWPVGATRGSRLQWTQTPRPQKQILGVEGSHVGGPLYMEHALENIQILEERWLRLTLLQHHRHQ